MQRAQLPDVLLHHTYDDGPGIARRGRAKSRFRYVHADGRSVRDGATLSRIRTLAVPPAWTAVWISSHPDGHIQATGRDARGRKQYRYHAEWRVERDAVKYHRFVDFCGALPDLRVTVDRDLACASLNKRKVVAVVVALMERAQLRVGNDEYARTNGSYGATTLRDRHARFHGDTLELAYRGKSGVERRVRVVDRRLSRIVHRCRDLPGQRLFQYVDGDAIRPILSTDVNEYLHESTGGPFTAKDYRTWAATVGAALLLSALEAPESQRASQHAIARMLATVAERLGHTPAVCRASYVHPRVLDDYATGKLVRVGRQIRRRLGRDATFDVATLRRIESIVARHLDSAAPSAPRRARRIAAR